jgi:hypothetical protein
MAPAAVGVRGPAPAVPPPRTSIVPR